MTPPIADILPFLLDLIQYLCIVVSEFVDSFLHVLCGPVFDFGYFFEPISLNTQYAIFNFFLELGAAVQIIQLELQALDLGSDKL